MNHERLYWYQSAFKPGALMHPLWWKAVGLELWQPIYGQNSRVTRSLDALLVKKRHFPTKPLPLSLDAEQQKLLRVAPKLPTLMLALGLIFLGCPEYLSLKYYRQALAEDLSDSQIEQILALWPDYYDDQADVIPENLVQAACIKAAESLHYFWHHDVVWQTFMVSVPPIQIGKAHVLDAREWLFRLDRLL